MHDAVTCERSLDPLDPPQASTPSSDESDARYASDASADDDDGSPTSSRVIEEPVVAEHAKDSSVHVDARTPELALSPSAVICVVDVTTIVPLPSRENAATMKSAAAHATET